jgi:phosphohistidine phosphatase
MKSLLILRHAQAAPESRALPDVQRPLTANGRAQAQALGTWLQQRGYLPDQIVCSAAVRTRETAETIAAAAAWTTQVSAVQQLYLASATELLAAVKSQSTEVRQLLVVAHAPGVADFISLLTTQQMDASLMCEAGTLAEVALDVAQWSELDAGIGALRLLLPP